MVDHAVLTGVDLHEPKGIASANFGEVYLADGAGSGVWTAPDTYAFAPKHIAGLTVENFATDTTNDITLLTGSCRDSTNTEDITLSSSLTKRLDAAWAVGTNAGGLDAGSIANTTYHMFVIKNPTTDVVDALFSTSPTAPSLPSGYTKFRRVASIRRVSGALQQVLTLEIAGGGLETLLVAAITDFTGALGTSATDIALPSIPAGVKFDAILTAEITAAGGATSATLSAVGTTGGAAFASLITDGTVFDAGQFRIRTDTTPKIIGYRNATNTASIAVHTWGWIDYRR